ncbi:MAG TPA: ABC transporter ATP-binding protein, partial [Terriglobales bacterium]
MTASPIFEVQNVSFEYERIPALRGLSLTIDRGQSVALVGANGSGKSTLLRLLDALSFPSSGTISFCGDQLSPELFRNDGYALSFRRRVALVFQNPDVQLFNPTVFDEVAFGPLQMDWSSAEVVAKVDKTLQ